MQYICVLMKIIYFDLKFSRWANASSSFFFFEKAGFSSFKTDKQECMRNSLRYFIIFKSIWKQYLKNMV